MGINRYALRPDYKLGAELNKLNLNFERVNCTGIDKEVRAFSDLADT